MSESNGERGYNEALKLTPEEHRALIDVHNDQKLDALEVGPDMVESMQRNRDGSITGTYRIAGTMDSSAGLIMTLGDMQEQGPDAATGVDFEFTFTGTFANEQTEYTNGKLMISRGASEQAESVLRTAIDRWFAKLAQQQPRAEERRREERVNPPAETQFGQCHSFDDLYAALQDAGTVEGSSRAYSGEKLADAIRKIRNREPGWTVRNIPRTHGLRDAVIRLLREEKR